jgi:hypothetical protein
LTVSSHSESDGLQRLGTRSYRFYSSTRVPIHINLWGVSRGVQRRVQPLGFSVVHVSLFTSISMWTTTVNLSNLQLVPAVCSCSNPRPQLQPLGTCGAQCDQWKAQCCTRRSKPTVVLGDVHRLIQLSMDCTRSNCVLTFQSTSTSVSSRNRGVGLSIPGVVSILSN